MGPARPPSTWDIPDEIKGPTAVPTTNLFIAILTSEKTGNDIEEALGELIAEEARFNTWYATAVHGRVAPEKQAAVHTATLDNVRRVYEPWADYLRVWTTQNAEAQRTGDYTSLIDNAEFDEVHEALVNALRTVRQDLAELRRSLGA